MLGIQLVHALAPLLLNGHEADFAKNSEVFGDGRLREADGLDDDADGLFAATGEEIEDLSAPGFGDGVEDIGGCGGSCHGEHHIPMLEYVKVGASEMRDWTYEDMRVVRGDHRIRRSARDIEGMDMTAIMQSVRLENEIQLTFSEKGDADGVPVLLVHGFTDSHRSFEPLMESLPSWMRVVAVSQRGHGDSDRPAWGYRTRDFAGDLAMFMDAMGMKEAVVVGHSMGTANAMRLAIDSPERVRGLVLAGAFATFAQNAALVEFFQTTIRGMVDPIMREFVREFQSSTLAKDVPAEFLELVVDESMKTPSRVWRGAFAGMLEDDFANELGSVRAPTLLVWGDKDGMASRGDQAMLLKRLREAALCVYEGGGHAVHWEEPERFAQDVTRFVEWLADQRGA